jgi:hypothetical protein
LKGKVMKIKNCFLAILLLITFGCAGPNINVHVIDSMGTPIPGKYYTATSTSQTPIMTTFYYVAEVEIEDADYSSIYLDRKQDYIKIEDYDRLSIVLHVYNPSKTIYRVRTFKAVVNENLDVETTKGVLALSGLEYRKYTLPLPLEEGIKFVSCNVTLTDGDGKEIYMQTGVFGYHLK